MRVVRLGVQMSMTDVTGFAISFACGAPWTDLPSRSRNHWNSQAARQMDIVWLYSSVDL